MAYGDGWEDPRDDINKRNSAYGPLGGDNTRNRMANRQFALRGGGGAAGQKKTGPINEAGVNNLSPSPGYNAGQESVPSALPASNEMVMNRQPAFRSQAVQAAGPIQMATPERPGDQLARESRGPIADAVPRFQMETPQNFPSGNVHQGIDYDWNKSVDPRPSGADAPGEMRRNDRFVAEGSQHAGQLAEAIAVNDYSNRVSRALQQMNSDQHREDRYNSIRGMLAPPPNPHDVASAELNQGGLFRRFTRRLGQVGIGALKGLAIGGPGGAVAGAILGGTGDIYRHDRTAQLIDDYARRRQAGEDALAVQKQEDQSDVAAERAYNFEERSQITRENNQLRYQLGQQGNQIKQQTANTRDEAVDETKRHNLATEEQKQEWLTQNGLKVVAYTRMANGMVQETYGKADGSPGLFMLDKSSGELVPVQGAEEAGVGKGNTAAAALGAKRLGLAEEANTRAAEKHKAEQKETAVKERTTELHGKWATKKKAEADAKVEAYRKAHPGVRQTVLDEMRDKYYKEIDTEWEKTKKERKETRAREEVEGKRPVKEKDKEKKKTGPVEEPPSRVGVAEYNGPAIGAPRRPGIQF